MMGRGEPPVVVNVNLGDFALALVQLTAAVTTLTHEVHAMDAKIQAALDAQNAKIDAAQTAIVDVITNEVGEVKTLISQIPTTGDPQEIASAIDAASSRLDTFASTVTTAVQAISDQVQTP